MTSRAEPASLLKHLPIIVGLIVLQLLARPLESVVYRYSIRPVLIHSGAIRCDSPTGLEAINNCDLMLQHRYGERIEQIYYSADGAVKIKRIIVGDAVLSSETVFWGNTARLVLPFAAVCVAFIATLRKILRTKSFFTWQLARHAWDDREKLLLLYSVPVFLTGLIQLAAVR